MITIAIEGISGAGKTTIASDLLERLKAHYSGKSIDVSLHHALDRIAYDQTTWRQSIEHLVSNANRGSMYAMAHWSLNHWLREVAAKSPRFQVNLLDRSIWSCLAYDQTRRATPVELSCLPDFALIVATRDWRTAGERTRLRDGGDSRGEFNHEAAAEFYDRLWRRSECVEHVLNDTHDDLANAQISAFEAVSGFIDTRLSLLGVL